MKYVIVETTLDFERQPEYAPGHLAWLHSLKERGHLFGAGPFTDGRGGMIIVEAANETEARALLAEDPYLKHRIRSAELREWQMRDL